LDQGYRQYERRFQEAEALSTRRLFLEKLAGSSVLLTLQPLMIIPGNGVPAPSRSMPGSQGSIMPAGTLANDPVNFTESEVRYYDNTFEGSVIDMGYACEMVLFNGNWYRSGVFGDRDYWKLGFTCIGWDKNGAFNIVRPSIVTNQ
jgi:hypothetical protein